MLSITIVCVLLLPCVWSLTACENPSKKNSANVSIQLFGLWEDNEPKAFAEKGVYLGDTIVVKNPKYNIYEGDVEMKEGTLVEIKTGE